jgi:hypothetical protein
MTTRKVQASGFSYQLEMAWAVESQAETCESAYATWDTNRNCGELRHGEQSTCPLLTSKESRDIVSMPMLERISFL